MGRTNRKEKVVASIAVIALITVIAFSLVLIIGNSRDQSLTPINLTEFQHVQEGQDRQHVQEGQDRQHVQEGQDRQPIQKGQDRQHIQKGQDRQPIQKGQDRQPIQKGQDRQPIQKGQDRQHVQNGQDRQHVQNGQDRQHVKKDKVRREIRQLDIYRYGASDNLDAAENNLELVKKDILQVIQTCPIPDLHDIQLEFDYGKDTKKYSCANKSTSHCFRQTQLGGVMRIHQISNTSFYDGDKWICYDPGLAPDPENCLVYSFGIGNEWSFDDAMAKYGCQVDTLGNIMRMLGHEGRRLDYLKIDIEGSEIPALEQVFRDSPHLLTQVSQLGIEVHPGMYPFDGNLDKTGKFYRVWRIYHLLECLGFQLLHMNVNQYPGTQYKWKDTLQSCCYELVWVMPPPRPIQT
ncbi:hypothetical protein Pmani_029983 [Petrolisthes manimaculis]|uniref:Methyltransferase FkbM domain-containing protein n=1 Tax=Petrolisthes manimaculis TaxID=1843537 RepID=A0AAE1NYU2_9EUCA|nr:hypothetical protein Pmani_029983 [Petrolisthes manimaculis]